MDEELTALAVEFYKLGADDIADDIEKGSFPLFALSKLEGHAHAILAACTKANALLAKAQGREP